MPDWQIEMLWDCTHCGRKRNRGRFKNCEGCGEPLQSAEEQWYMPGDTSYDARVTDKQQLKHAKAGADWSCEFCGGNQRDLDGNCQNCGGAKVDIYKQAPRHRPVPSYDYDDEGLKQYGIGGHQKKVAIIVVSVVALFGLVMYFLFRTVEKEVSVKSVHWQHTVHVERYQVTGSEGFDEKMPSNAFNVQKHGQRHHHDEKILDHYKTVHYTERVACGQNCYTTPRTCYTTPRTCTPNSNGYASCSGGDRVCTGGDRRCDTKYCNEPRTRKEPVYRYEPRYETWYSWNVWRWLPNRSPAVSGSSVETNWPSKKQIALNQGLANGEKERSRRESSYKVVFTDGKKDYDFTPQSLDQFTTFPVGSEHTVLYSITGGVKLPE